MVARLRRMQPQLEGPAEVIELQRVKRTYPLLLADMKEHYSQPKGFVGRNICYAVVYKDRYYGGIVGGSSVAHLNGRDFFFDSWLGPEWWHRERIVNNVFFHIKPVDGEYPIRNFAQRVLAAFRDRIILDWRREYGDHVVGFETLVELPRTGEVYRRDRWKEVGRTIGYTCKRTGGVGTDTWTGKRVWNTTDLRPKLVLCRIR